MHCGCHVPNFAFLLDHLTFDMVIKQIIRKEFARARANDEPGPLNL